MRRLIFIALLSVSFCGFAQRGKPAFDHVEPPFWWTGMKNPTVQILFHNSKTDFRGAQVSTSYPGVTVTRVETVENPHYLFVTLDLANAKPGEVQFKFVNGKKTFTYSYLLKARSTDSARVNGFDPSDVIYLIMPDRFANGDLKNDSIPGMFEGANRAKPGARHGGDIKGIRDRLDYIDKLGVTAVWLNPVLENNQRKASYHGYAITDLYRVDRRFGTNEDYLAFVNECHSRGLKVVQDMVMNHIGDEHWLMHDLPEKSWVHQFPEFTRSNYRSTVISDPYRAEDDLRLMNDGWFDTTMPDVNQTNPLFATYLVQNTVWWIEYAGLDGIRMDTYPYPDKTFMARWCKEVREEFPKINLVGEVWINDVATTAYWQKDMINRDGYQSFLPSVTDFPLFFTLPQALTEEAGWDSGLARLYNLLARDFIYPDPGSNLIFPDNHDVTRFFLLCGKDIRKFKMGLAFILTTRGIPQLYYGTELLMDGDGGFHPNVRLDFPGGWPTDKTNAFQREGRTAEQNEVHDFLTKLLNWRKGETAIHRGKLTHYIPEDNIYVYFRSHEGRSIMVIMNGNATEKTLRTHRFRESLNGSSGGRDVLSGETLSVEQIALPAFTTRIIELNKGQ